MHILDALIIGAGPSGLSAAEALNKQGLNYRIIEQGSEISERNRDIKAHIPSGVGGAGLYSDGKFSFYPSASKLWTLKNKKFLNSSYQWLSQELAKYEVNAPAFAHEKSTEDGFKFYPSEYLSIEHREKFIRELSLPHKKKLFTKTEAISIRMRGDLLYVYCRREDGELTFVTRHLILAGGRFSPLWLKKQGIEWNKIFRRIEVGARIYGDYRHPFFQALKKQGKSIDPKYIIKSENEEWRTFCFCDRGEMVPSLFDGHVFLSGRGDGVPTNESNIGFNYRILDSSKKLNIPTAYKPFSYSLKQILENPQILESIYDPEYLQGFIKGLELMSEKFSEFKSGFKGGLRLAGPTLEGVGQYPDLNTSNLKMPGLPIYVPGDGGGMFRGIVAALVSGHYVGESIAAKINKKIKISGQRKIAVG